MKGLQRAIGRTFFHCFMSIPNIQNDQSHNNKSHQTKIFLIIPCILVCVPLDAVREEWSKTRGLKEVAFLAKYYELFRDIFDGTEFMPKVWLDVNFENKGVFRGNLIAPSEV